MEPTASNPEELLRHAQWLRRLALRLAEDEAAAEDLVQETWLAALRRPPRKEGARSWLARVLTNVALQRRRSAARRVGREAAKAGERREVLSPEELALRLEQEQRLLSAVAGMSDPYKTVVLLRFEEGLSAVEIARQRGVPAATVRTQLHRGVEDLRRRMDAGPGGRAAWAALLAPGAGVWKSGGAVAAMEVIGMTSTTKLGLVGAAVLLASLGTWTLIGPRSESDTRAGKEAPRAADTSRAQPEVPHEPAPAIAATREEVPISPPPKVEAARAHLFEVHLFEVHLFEARIVDGRGAPVAEARLVWTDEEDGEVESDPSKADGRVELEVAAARLDGEKTLWAQAPGYLTLALEVAAPEGERTELGDIALQGGATLTGTVVDERGSPVPGARLCLTWAHALEGRGPEARRGGPEMSSYWAGAEEGVSDGDGRFEFDSFATGTRVLWVGAAGSLWTIEGPFEIAPGESRDFPVTLEEAPRALRIAGVVLDPNGRGVPQAHLWFYDDPRGGKHSGTADGEGRFDLVLRADRPHQLRAVDPEERFPECAQSGVAPGTTDVVLQFRSARWLAIVAQNQEGDLIPIETLYATNRAENNIIANGKASGVAEAGVQLLEPAEPFLVKILAPGYEEGHFGPFQPGSLAERSEFRLESLEGVRGLVRQAGRPVAGARVELYAAIGDKLVIYSRGFRATRRSFPYEQTITDAEGRFRLTPREASDFFVRVEADNLAPAEQEVAGYEPKRGENLVFDLTEGGVIHGVVHPPRGEEPNGLMVAASRGDGNEEKVRTDEEGLFRFERLMPGRWFVEVLVDDLSSPGETLMGLGALEAPPFEWNVEVREGEESFVELDLGLSPRAVLAGELLLDGSPAEGWIVGLSPWSRPSGRPSEHPQATLDGRGRFQLVTPILGGQTLTLNDGSHSVLTLCADLDLSDGVQEWRLELETGAVWVENVPSTSDEFFRPHLSWTDENGVSARLVLWPDEDGVAHLERVPAGHLELCHHPKGRGSPAVVADTFELLPGEEAVASFGE